MADENDQDKPEQSVLPQAVVTQEDTDGYIPVFNKTFRTIIYVLGVICSVAAIVLAALSTDLGWPKWAVDLIAVLSPILPGVASAFGVHYAGISK